MNTKYHILAGLALVLTAAGCENASRTERDAARGAAAGAVIGGIIGHQSDDTAEGAAIGAVVGGAAGALHGQAKERRERRLADDRYTDADYRDLLTDDEVDILRARARASGVDDYELTDFLTAREKENLRRRDRTRREIGS